jgi:kinetochore protein Spc24
MLASNKYQKLIGFYEISSLQLWVYHSLGIELQEDGTGSFSKAVVRNPTKGDVHVINIEPQRFPPEFYVEYLWKLL